MVSRLLLPVTIAKAHTGDTGLTVIVKGKVEDCPRKVGVNPCCGRNGREASSAIRIETDETGKLTDTDTHVASCALGLGLACGVEIQIAERIEPGVRGLLVISGTQKSWASSATDATPIWGKLG
jgi:hypothetical protein